MREIRSARALAQAVARRELSSVELVSDAIARVEKDDGNIRAVVARDFERALFLAEQADRAVKAETAAGVFHGVPMTVKECLHVEGLKTTFGKPEFAQNVAAADAESVTRMRQAGAIIIGKTNVPTDLADCQTYNPVYGTTVNPYDHGRTCGGSSGGSAAALAAGYVSIELGSDLAGSIRTPAHFCGVYGHKSSYGIISQAGHALSMVPRDEADIAVIGPMARTARDLKAAFEALIEPDHSISPWQLQLPMTRISALRGLKVAILAEHPLCRISTDTHKALHSLGETLRNAGVTVVDEPPMPIDLARAHRDFMVMYRSVGVSNLPEAARREMASGVANLDPDDYSYGASGKRAAALLHSDWLAIAHAREVYRQQWREFFGSFDLLICPVHATTAFPHDHHVPREARLIEVDGEAQPYNDYLFWAGIAGLAGLPSTVVPVSKSSAGLPIAVQVVAGRFQDLDSLAFAEMLETHLGE